MSVGAITAGEAYVSITCDNAELVAGLNESSDAIRSTAQEIASMEDALTVSVGVEGVGALESALTRIEGAVKRTGTETVAAFGIAAEAAGTAFRKIKTAVLNAASAFGDYGDAFDKMTARAGGSTETPEWQNAARGPANFENAQRFRASRRATADSKRPKSRMLCATLK